jgi:hypothetical protein
MGETDQEKPFMYPHVIQYETREQAFARRLALADARAAERPPRRRRRSRRPAPTPSTPAFA